MTQPLSLLLVDPDPEGLETLTYGFERDGANVNATSDMLAAPKLVGAAAPSLVVVALRPSEPSGFEVIKRMRTGGHAIPHVAVLALGPAEQQAEARAAGASDFLAMPAFIHDVVNAGKLAMVGRRASGQDEPLTEARLSDFRGLYYLLRAMAATGASAVMRLERGNRRAELRIAEGRLVSANVEALQSLPALHHVLLWDEASLSLRLGTVGKRKQLNLLAQEVLDESERFLRDFAHAARDLGPPDTLYVATARESGTPGLQASQSAPLLRLCDGRRVLADVIAESPFRIFDTLRMLKRLRDSGAVAARAPAADGAHAPGRNGAGRSMLGEWAMVPDLRGVVGDRRSTSRPQRAGGTGPTPLPLVKRKNPGSGPTPATTVSGATATAAAGEIVQRRGGTPAAGTADLGVAPTIQIKVDSDGAPLTPPLALAPAASAPVTLARGSGQGTPIQLRTRIDQAARAQMDRTPPPLLRGPSLRSPTGPQAPLQQRAPSGPHAPLQQRSPSGPHAPLQQRAPSGPHAPLQQRSPSGPHVPLQQRAPSGPHAPLEKRSPSGPQPRLEKTPAPRVDRTPAPRLNKPPSGPQPTAAGTFDDLEADFFAREADLYKREAVETFDDLDHPLGRAPAKPRPRKR
jgi:CheY-like chemotaxis protein